MLHVFHFMDGSWRIDRPTNSTIPFVDLIRHEKVKALYEGIYRTRIEAAEAKDQILEILAAIKAEREAAEAVMASEPDNGDRFW